MSPLVTRSIIDNSLWRWWLHNVVGEVDHARIVGRVADEARWSARYCFMIVISVLISILGLLLPSSAVLIGAMLISPLMMPIIGLGFAIATFDSEEIRRAAFALAAGSLIAVVISMLFVAASPVQTITSEIASRTKPNLFDLLVAMLSAVAGSYALIRGRGETVVGVAIAIALMPPLAVVGFGIATGNWTVFSGSLLLFFTNLVVMALTAAVMARLYGFGAHLSPVQTRLQGVLIVIGIAALAVPLALALKQIAWESVAQRQIRDAVIASFPAGARISEIDIEFDRDPIRVRAAVLTARLEPRADAAAIARARGAVGQPLDLHIDQIRVGTEAGAGEAAQIAAAQANVSQRRADGVVREQLATLAGAQAAAVLLDSERRTASVDAAQLPGATLATYRALEGRAAALLTGWTVRLVPPAAALPPVSFDENTPDPQAIATAVWGARRLGLPVGVSGNAAQADAVIAALTEAGVTARRQPGNGPVTLSWLAPTPEPGS